MNPSASRGIAILCAVFFASAHTAQAGINVWTSNGPRTEGNVSPLALDPTTPSTLYAGLH